MSMSVCVSACVCVCLSAIVASDLPQILVHVTFGCGSVLLCRRGDALRISGFMDDVIFAHKLRLLDVIARLRQ